MFLGVLIEAWFLYRNHGSIQRITGQVEVLRGNPKGRGRTVLCRGGGGVHRGATPSNGSHPYAVFLLLFVRTKSIPGYGGGAPEKFRKETYFFPARRRANPSPSVPCAGAGASKTEV